MKPENVTLVQLAETQTCGPEAEAGNIDLTGDLHLRCMTQQTPRAFCPGPRSVGFIKASRHAPPCNLPFGLIHNFPIYVIGYTHATAVVCIASFGLKRRLLMICSFLFRMNAEILGPEKLLLQQYRKSYYDNDCLMIYFQSRSSLHHILLRLFNCFV